jgi:hypothetical protein
MNTSYHHFRCISIYAFKPLFRVIPFLKIILIAGLILLSSCKKEESNPVLPPFTNTGANTFGAVVNGEIFTVEGAGNFSGGLYADPVADSCFTCWHPPDSSDLFLRIRQKNGSMFYIFLTDPRHTTEWRLNKPTLAFWDLDNNTKAYVEIKTIRSSINTDGYIRSDFHSRDDGIFSAEFNYRCINTKTCQEFSVTDGRIDVNLNKISYYP